MSQRRRTRILTGLALAFLAGALVIPSLCGLATAFADDAIDAQQLVAQARMTFEAFNADSDMGPSMRSIVQRAKAVLIYPQVLRLAFVFGASGGSGVLLAHDPNTKTWSGPAFYTIGQASFGIQIGGDAAEVVLVALTDRGLSALLSTSAKLGADVGVALGPIGVGAEAATANLSVDLVSYSRAKGLYAGVSVNGAVVATRGALNEAYYGKEVTPTAILIEREVTNPHAAPLLEAVAKVASGK
jgi:lipid-binding SYLF domain-containing protein